MTPSAFILIFHCVKTTNLVSKGSFFTIIVKIESINLLRGGGSLVFLHVDRFVYIWERVKLSDEGINY